MTSISLISVYPPLIPFFYKSVLTKGFFIGGEVTGIVTTADRTTYATETSAAVTGANSILGTSYAVGAGTGNDVAGYTSNDQINSVQKTTYSTEVTASSTAGFSGTQKNGFGGAGNNDKGFFTGGLQGAATWQPASHRTTYASETSALVTSANLTLSRSGYYIVGNLEKAIIAGGLQVGVNSPRTEAEKCDFATETMALAPGADIGARPGLTAQGGAGTQFKAVFINFGIFICTFATETTVYNGAYYFERLGNGNAGNTTKSFHSGGVASGNYGGGKVNSSTKFDCATETASAATGANLSSIRSNLVGV